MAIGFLLKCTQMSNKQFCVSHKGYSLFKLLIYLHHTLRNLTQGACISLLASVYRTVALQMLVRE